MSKAQLVITALFVEHQAPAQVAVRYGVHRSWVYKLKARYETEGEAGFEPGSRRPHSSPAALDPRSVDLILELREKLTAVGLDPGPETIAWHLCQHHQVSVSRSTTAPATPCTCPPTRESVARSCSPPSANPLPHTGSPPRP